MEINDFGELNALNKLFGRVKFNDDIDFYEFKEFVASPLIASIYKRVHEQFISELQKQGRLSKDFRADFQYDSTAGRTLRKRIDELTEHERDSLKQNGSIDSYLEVLIAPLSFEDTDFQLLKEYYLNREKSS